ncbi:hypothetical protein ABZ832_28120 [Streptantibioticus parmotrematis]|uniref:hypothetical protein n=1 Tax=Streptantibioticus parmotrematis TaxID=2873249 RepID=UPI0033EEB516
MTPEDIHALATWSWLEKTAIGQVAFLLAAHPEGAYEARDFADALGLAEPSRSIPYIGERVTLDARGARLRVDGWSHDVRLSVGDQWSRFVADGGPVAVLVGLDPLPRCAQPEEVAAYLLKCDMRMGTTAIRGGGTRET